MAAFIPLKAIKKGKRMKMILSVLFAAVVTAGLLFLMSLFISDEQVKEETKPPTVEVADVTIPEKKPKPRPSEVKPPKPPAFEPAPDKRGQVIETAETDSLQDEWIARDPNLDVSLPTGLGSIPDMEFSQDSEAMPMFRTQPNYPMIAQQRGLEGWVLLKYDVDTSGTLSNIAVIDSEPRKIFDKEATRALRKWKFKPAMTNGQPIASLGQTVKIEFKMDQE